MNPSVQALLDGIVDYAGLFPPAKLPMEEAWRRFLRHSDSDDGWMLARFVCPAVRLEELEALLAETEDSHLPVSVAVLGRGGDALDDFLESVDQDAAAMQGFSIRQKGRAVADVFEVKLPETGGAAVAVEKALRRLNEVGSPSLLPYFEVSLLGEWRPRLPAAAAAVRDTARAADQERRVGLKIRCGGVDAAAIPEPMAVAAAIATCRAVEVPLKATQGLHHPFRHLDTTLSAEVHGFLNLFAASVLAYARDLPVIQLTEIVAEMDPMAFVFSADGIGWRDSSASAEEVAAARMKILTSFGSCSFTEPRDDLGNMNLLG